MINQIKKNIIKLVFSNTFSHLLISILFFFAWGDLLIDRGGYFEEWIFFLMEHPKYGLWLFYIGGMFIPILLFIGAVQYKSKLAYVLTLFVFFLTIISNLAEIPSYLQEQKHLEIYGSTICSCDPLFEIKTIFKFSTSALVAIFLMTRKRMLENFGW